MKIISLLLMALVIGGVISISSCMEASTYNRMCRPKVQATMLDALASELRVDGSCGK